MLIGKADNIATKRRHQQLKRKAAADLRVARNKKSNKEAEDGDGNLPGHGSSTSSDWEIDHDLPLARMIPTPSKNKKPNNRPKNSLHLQP